MSVKSIVVVLTCLLWSFPVPGQAFFPEASEVVNQIQKEFRGLQSLQAEITFPEDLSMSVFVWHKGESWRQEWVQERSDRQAVVGAGVGFGSTLLASYPDVQNFPQPVLNFWYRQPLDSWLQDMGIDTSVMSYQFQGNRPCLVLGARYGESNRAQIWIDKELHVPRKVVTWKGVRWTWSEYYRVGNFRLPHEARVHLPFGTSVEMALNWRAVNKNIPEQLFSSEAFADTFSGAGVPEVDSEVYDIFFTQVPAALP